MIPHRPIHTLWAGLIIGLIVSATAIAQTTSPAPEWRMVWSDEFEGTAIDRAKWDFDKGNGMFGWGNDELQSVNVHDPVGRIDGLAE